MSATIPPVSPEKLKMVVRMGNEGDFYADLTKPQVEAFPPYDENAVESQEKWASYENQYRSAWGATPGHQGGTESANPSSPRTNLGQRWSKFENRIRTDRDRIVSTCKTCSRPATSERFERERKIS